MTYCSFLFWNCLRWLKFMAMLSNLINSNGILMYLIQFSLNVFTEFSDKNYNILKRLFEPATFCGRDWDATTAPARHMSQRWSLNWAQFMAQWFIRFPEFTKFLIHLGKIHYQCNFNFSCLVQADNFILLSTQQWRMLGTCILHAPSKSKFFSFYMQYSAKIIPL